MARESSEEARTQNFDLTFPFSGSESASRVKIGYFHNNRDRTSSWRRPWGWP